MRQYCKPELRLIGLRQEEGLACNGSVDVLKDNDKKKHDDFDFCSFGNFGKWFN